MTRGAAVEEVPISIFVNGERVVVGSCSPGALEAWAIGRLSTEGYLTTMADVRAVTVHGTDHARTVQVELPLPAAQNGEAERRHRSYTGCGLLHYLECAPHLLNRPRSLRVPEPARLTELYRALFESGEAHRETGGMHSAALTDGERLILVAHDVGRHNAVDKVIGAAIMSGMQPGGCGLLLTARISGDIAAKAGRAGLSWVASRSVPTSLALRVAAVANMPLVSRAVGKDAFVHEPPPDAAS